MTESPARNSAKSSVDLAEAPIRVLSVDDEAGFLKITKQILEVHDAFQVDTASSVDEAMDKMKKTTYDVIVSDYQIPGKDGLQFLKELRDGENDVPFILFTGKGREEIAIQALNLGADRYFNKMGDPETVYGELTHGIRQVVERKKADTIIQRQNEFLQNTLDSLPHPFYIIDAGDYTVRLANSASGFGDRFKGLTCYELTHKREKPCAGKHVCPLEEVKKTKKPVVVEHNHYGAEGNVKTFEVYGYPILANDGNVVQMIESELDITERKKAEEELRQSERRFRTVVENSPDFIVLVKRNGIIFDVNRLSKGYTREMVIGQSIFNEDWYGTKDQARVAREQINRVFRTGKSGSFEYTQTSPDALLSFYETRVAPFEHDSEGNIIFIQCATRDITQRKKAEEERNKLLDSYEERVKELRCLYGISKLDEKPNGLLDEILRETNLLLTPAWQYPDVTCSRIIYENQEFKTKNFKETQWKQHADVKVQGKKVGVVEVYYLEKKPIFAEGPFLEEERNMIEAVAKSLGGIIERKKSEKALEESEERYRSLFESAKEGITITDSEGKIVRMNDSFAAMLGYDSAEELVGIPAVELYHDQKARTIMFEEIMERGYVEGYELTLKKRNGSPINVLGSSLTRKDEEDNLLQTEGFFMDITERKKAENALQESEERYRTLFEFAREGMMITGPEGKITRVNSAAAAMLGYDSPEELVGILAVELYLDPKDREAMFKETMRRGYVDHYEVIFKKRDGSPLYILGSNVTRKDDEGKIVQIEVFFMDITERKTREEEMKRRLMRFRLDDGNLYLVKESVPSLSLEAFKDLLNVGYHGLVFSRTPEDEFKKKR